jgi:hypothetical protein
MATINVTKVREELRLNDEPDSPVYYLDFTDTGIDKLYGEAQKVKNNIERLQKLLKEQQADGNTAKEKNLKAELAKTLKHGITLFLGDGAYAEIVAYVGDGVISNTDVSFELSVVFLHCASRLYDRVQGRIQNEYARYTRKDNESATDII